MISQLNFSILSRCSNSRNERESAPSKLLNCDRGRGRSRRERAREGIGHTMVRAVDVNYVPSSPVCKYNFFKCLAVTADTHAYIIKYSLICKFICPLFRRAKHLHPLRDPPPIKRTITRIKSFRASIRLSILERSQEGRGDERVFFGD